MLGGLGQGFSPTEAQPCKGPGRDPRLRGSGSRVTTVTDKASAGAKVPGLVLVAGLASL